jgi:hypothetical protein
MVYCNWLIFSMFSGSFLEKALFRSFVFKMFSGLGFCWVSGHKVVPQSVAGKARIRSIIHSLLAPRAGR